MEPPKSGQRKLRPQGDLNGADADLSRTFFEAASGGGQVNVRVDGHGAVRRLVIAPETFTGRDPDLLADLIMSAIAEAQRRARGETVLPEDFAAE